MGRTAWTAAVAFALGVAVGFGSRGCGTAPSPETPPISNRVEASPPVSRETSRRARPSADELDANAGADALAVTSPPPLQRGGDVREIPQDDAATGFDEVAIEVVDAEGEPAPWVFVYGLPVGAPGESDEDAMPHAQTGDDGRCRILFPSPQSFDVVAMAQFVHARIEGVRIPGTASLRIRLPAPSVATFILDAESPPPGDVNFSIRAAPHRDLRQYPARGEPRATDTWGGMVGAGHPVHELPLGLAEFEVTQAATVAIRNGVAEQVAPTNHAVFEPRRFVPPATIRVRRADPSARSLDVGISFKEPEGVWHQDRRYSYRLEFDEVVVEETAWFSWDGNSAGRLATTQVVRSPTGTLRWSGPRIVSGAAPWDLERSAKLDITIEVRPTAPGEGVRVVVDLPREAAYDEGRVLVFYRNPLYPAEVERALIPVRQEALLDDPGDWLLVDVHRDEGPLDRLVAGPVRARTGALVTMTPRRGGFVVFAPATPPGESAGDVTVARADGAPFPYAQYGDDRHACRTPLVPGAVLGPFEPGVVTLDVFIGAVRWGRYEVTVREGVWTTFAPRPFR